MRARILADTNKAIVWWYHSRKVGSCYPKKEKEKKGWEFGSIAFRFSQAPVLLQLRGRKEGDFVVPPAGTLILSASDGLLGLGCVGDPRLQRRRCTVGTSLSRSLCPGDAGEVEAAAALWNKSFRPRPYLGGVVSGAGERPVKAGSDGAGGSATAELRPVLGDADVGVHSSLLKPGMVLAVVMFYRGMAKGLVEARWMDWLLFFAACWRWVLFHGRRSSGCVPGRCASTLFFFCGSFQSLWRWGFFRSG